MQRKIIKQRITQWCRKHPTSASTLLIKKSNRFLSHILLIFATLTGYVPLSIVRIVLYRAVFGVDIPKDSVIFGRCRFKDPSNVHVGHNTIIGGDVFLDGRHGLYIGDNVSIGQQVLIFTREHDINSPTFEGVGGPVVIEDRAFLGSRVTILPEVRIGTGAVVASGAVVVKDVEPWTLVGGVPAKFIKRRPVLDYVLDTSQPDLF
jgi:acetyltransferase-like isoleucine patch superfamily enzyme